MLNVFNNTKVYIVCPHNFVTGGVESLHQLSFKLQDLGIRAHMVYYPFTDNPIIPRPYSKYKPVPAHFIEDEVYNILIVPEIYIDYSLDDYKKIRKAIWWLSVDNYVYQSLDRQMPDLGFISTRNIRNFVQSAHAKDFLRRYQIKVDAYLAGYINSHFREECEDHTIRNNNVLYNPNKGYEYTSRLIQAAPELNWIALKDLTVAQVRQAFLSSKVYIDFGHHPGRDRFPREAAVSGCCIITGTRGSAAWFDDLPIPHTFKFDQNTSDIYDIIARIKECLSDYESQVIHFHPFCERVKNEEERLVHDIKNIFNYP